MTTIEQPGRGALRMVLHPAVLLNVLAPLLTFQVLTHLGATDLTALSVATVFPLAEVARSVARDRRIDALGALTLGAIAVGLAVGMLTADPYVLLVKDSLTTAAIGLAFLGSLAASRPMIYRLAGQFADPDRVAHRWAESAGFRHVLRRMTLVWGLALLAEAALRVAVSLLVTPAVLVTMSPLLTAAVIVPTIAWTPRARRRAVAA